jgi:hypothetical protein
MIAAHRAPAPPADRFGLFTTMHAFHIVSPDAAEMRLENEYTPSAVQ